MGEGDDETLLERTNREFNTAVAQHRYASALEAVRWIYDSRLGSDALDKANAEPSSEAVFEKRLSPESIPGMLRTLVFSAENVPPALLLYVADLLAGEKLGRPKKRKANVIIDEITLINRIAELHKQGGSKQKAYELAASEGFGNGNAESVKRAYIRATKNRTTGF